MNGEWVLIRRSYEDTEENHENLSQDIPVTWRRFEPDYKSVALQLDRTDTSRDQCVVCFFLKKKLYGKVWT